MNKKFIFPLLVILAGLALAAYGWRTYQNPQIVIEWSTASELDVAGFHIWRSTSADGDRVQLTRSLIPPSPDPLTGGDYSYTDDEVERGTVYFYFLEEIEFSGNTAFHGPIETAAPPNGLLEGLSGLILIAAGVLSLASERRRQP